MPNRVIRESLLSSDRFLGLRDNTGRICFVAIMLTADDVGNLEGSPPRLRRLWRDYGIDTNEKVAKTLAELADCDLVRVYEAENKQFIHIPRFRQFLRHVKRRAYASPWDDDEKIQSVIEKTQRERSADALLPRPETNRSESNRNEGEQPVYNSPWWKTDKGIENKGIELGIKPKPGETYYDLKARIFDNLKTKA